MSVLLKVFAIFAFFMVAFFAVTKWHIREVTAFCGDVRPGMTLSSLRQAAEAHGIADHAIDHGVFDKQDKTWTIFVPVAETFGDVTCVVQHDGTTVISAKMDGA